MIVHGGASLAGNDSLDAARDALRESISSRSRATVRLTLNLDLAAPGFFMPRCWHRDLEHPVAEVCLGFVRHNARRQREDPGKAPVGSLAP